MLNVMVCRGLLLTLVIICKQKRKRIVKNPSLSIEKEDGTDMLIAAISIVLTIWRFLQVMSPENDL